MVEAHVTSCLAALAIRCTLAGFVLLGAAPPVRGQSPAGQPAGSRAQASLGESAPVAGEPQGGGAIEAGSPGESPPPTVDLAVPGNSLDPKAVQRRKLQGQLQEVELERADTSRLWPLLTLVVGGVAALGGMVAGVAGGAGCPAGCEAPPWAGAVVLSGAFVGGVGLLWWRLVEEDIAEIESRRFQIRRDLDRLDAASAPAARAALSFTSRF